MTFAMTLSILMSLGVYLGLVLISNRRIGAAVAQLGTVLAAGALFVVATQGNAAAHTLSPYLLPAGIGLLAVTTGAMGYHLFLGRFTSLWVPRGVFLAVSAGIAGALAALFLLRD